jgi:hypothetical protein
MPRSPRCLGATLLGLAVIVVTVGACRRPDQPPAPKTLDAVVVGAGDTSSPAQARARCRLG